MFQKIPVLLFILCKCLKWDLERLLSTCQKISQKIFKILRVCSSISSVDQKRFAENKLRMCDMAQTIQDYDPINSNFLPSPLLCPLSGTISFKLLCLVMHLSYHCSSVGHTQHQWPFQRPSASDMKIQCTLIAHTLFLVKYQCSANLYIEKNRFSVLGTTDVSLLLH